MKKFTTYAAIGILLLAAGAPAFAAEHSIGKPIVKNGLILHAVYLQPVHMAPVVPGLNHGKFDVHLEADIHADKNNRQGFSPGAWIPYLTVSYQVEKIGSHWSTFGTMMAMAANDGPHYGANVKLDGPGKYRLSLRLMPPSYNGFFHHTDKETGVARWWKPMIVSWKFTYVGVGKKGGY
jgi:uncharacterized protein involved in high-affinity Fe2+ transport